MAGPLIGEYTDTGTVRATAGVTDNEVDDDTLLSMQLGLAISADLYLWLADPAAVKAEGEGTGATPEQKQKWNLLQLYVASFCAAKVLESSMHLPAQKTNGKDAFKRFSDKTLAEAVASLRRRAADYRLQLEKIIAPSTGGDSGLFARASPAYDPVTNT
jgi:hypothetical protein